MNLSAIGPKFSRIFWIFILCVSVIDFNLAFGQDGSERKRRRREEKAEKHQVSKLTYEISEKEADRVIYHLQMGVDKVIDLSKEIELPPERGGIYEGSQGIVEVFPVPVSGDVPRQVILKPKGEGQTNVDVRDKTGRLVIHALVYVSKFDLQKIFADLKRELLDVEGLDLKLDGNRIVLRGEVLTTEDYGKVMNEIYDRNYGEVFVNKVTMSPITLGQLAKKVETELQVFAPTVKVSALNGRLILEGTVESDAIRARCVRRAEWFLPTVRVSDPINKDQNNIEKNEKPLALIQNDIQINAPPPKRESKLVRLTMYFVELSKDFLKTYGFKWQPGFTSDPSISIGQTPGGAVNAGGGFTFSGTLSSLFPSLNAPPSSASYGKILKTANIIVKSGESGKVNDFQEIPTQTLGQNGMVTPGTPVRVGFDASITPTILQGQDIDLNVDLSNDNVVGIGVGGTPIVGRHKVVTRLYLKSGEVAAVAGVSGQDLSTSFNRDDPRSTQAQTATRPLFTLLRSKNSAKKRGQFVIFISPTVIESASEGTEDLKKNFRIPAGGIK